MTLSLGSCSSALFAMEITSSFPPAALRMMSCLTGNGPVEKMVDDSEAHKQLLLLLEAHANKNGEVPPAKYTNRALRHAVPQQQGPATKDKAEVNTAGSGSDLRAAGPSSRQPIESDDIDALLQCVAFPPLSVRQKAGTGGASSDRAGKQTDRVEALQRALEAKRVDVAEKKQKLQMFEQVTAVQVALA